jgi:UDP-N-acetylglucosamine pyrophosphorylase
MFLFSHRIFNTNNLWINLPAIKRVIEEKTLHMEIIVNHKVKLNSQKKTISFFLFARLWIKVLTLFN